MTNPPETPERRSGVLRWLVDVPTRTVYGVGALVILPLLAAVVAYSVFARYAFHSPLQGGDEVSGFLLLTLFAAAIPMVTASEGHVRMETLHERLPRRWRRAADALGHLCGALFLGLLAIGEWLELPGMIRRGDGAQLVDFPHWPLSLCVALCATYVTALLLGMAWAALRDAFAGKVEP